LSCEEVGAEVAETVTLSGLRDAVFGNAIGVGDYRNVVCITHNRQSNEIHVL